jgi:hypothetical protein
MEGVSNRTGSPPWGSAPVERIVTVTVTSRGTRHRWAPSPGCPAPPIVDVAEPVHVAIPRPTPRRGWPGDTAAGRG